MKLYLASSYSTFPQMQEYGSQLEALGFVICSRWILGDHQLRSGNKAFSKEFMPLWAKEDVEDVLSADALVMFNNDTPYLTRGGKDVEFGLALGTKKPVILIGEKTNVFHYLPVIKHYDSFNSLLEAAKNGLVDELWMEINVEE